MDIKIRLLLNTVRLLSTFTASCPDWVKFDVCDNCHVKLKHYLLGQSRDICQTMVHETVKRVFCRIVQEDL